MSTRCQVKVVQRGLGWEEAVTLYHHYDGYPSNMLELFEKAYKDFGRGYEAGRAGKVASFLCAIDPGVFEPEEGHELHGDIEYYYLIEAHNVKSGTIDDQPYWNVTVYSVKFNSERTTEKDLRKIYGPKDVRAALKDLKKIERKEASLS